MPNLTVYVQCKRNAYCYPVIHALHNITVTYIKILLDWIWIIVFSNLGGL